MEQLNIKTMSDWYAVSHDHLSKLGGTRFLQKSGGLKKLLEKNFPDFQWDWNFFDSQVQISKYCILKLKANVGQTKSQNFLQKTLQEIFPNVSDFHINFKHPEMFFPDSKMSMELDIYIPSLKIAFEYQGSQHYQYHAGFYISLVKIIVSIWRPF
jgi:hypothetical protein